MKIRISFTLLLILACPLCLQAEVITIFDSNSIISGGAYDTVVIKGDGTVVDMTGGDVNNLITMNASTFNMSGGSIGFEINKGIVCYDSSTLNLSGGNIRKVYAFEESKLTISGDPNIDFSDFGGLSIATISTYGGLIERCSFTGNSIGNISSGFFSWMTIHGNNIVDVNDTEVTHNIHIYGNPKVNIRGITTNILYVNSLSSAVINIFGGNINNFSPTGDPFLDCKINIIGYDLNLVPYGGNHGYGAITGYWNNDTPFNISLGYESEFPSALYAHIKLYDGVIPPDCIAQPQSDLNDDCFVNFIDFSTMANEWMDCGLADSNDCLL
ncbi:MAG: hypothetical protein ACYSSP_10580 [Planctomycetota bacterium]|jgi:hypothetical protein